MALKHVQHAIKLNIKPHSAKLALLTMAAQADHVGYVFDTVTGLAGKLPIERRHMIRIIQRLTETGLIRMIGRRRDGRLTKWRLFP